MSGVTDAVARAYSFPLWWFDYHHCAICWRPRLTYARLGGPQVSPQRGSPKSAVLPNTKLARLHCGAFANLKDWPKAAARSSWHGGFRAGTCER